MTTERNIKYGQWTALLSFIVGTVLFGLYYLTGSIDIAFFGCFYIFTAGLINVIIITILFIKAYKDTTQRRKIVKVIGLMFCSISIIFVYIYFVTVLLNTMRMTFINETGKPLTEIKIISYEPKSSDKLASNKPKSVWVPIAGDSLRRSIEILNMTNVEKNNIDALAPNESKSVWFSITKNSGMTIKYVIDGETKIDIVYLHLSNLCGQIATYKIGIDKPRESPYLAE